MSCRDHVHTSINLCIDVKVRGAGRFTDVLGDALRRQEERRDLPFRGSDLWSWPIGLTELNEAGSEESLHVLIPPA